MRLPTFLVCGAAKSGTTSLYNYLAVHPNVFMSRQKEPNFFNRHYDRGVDWYASFFNEWDGEVAVGEASPSSMAHASLTAERIAQVLPSVKLVFLLRNPIDRLFSDYWFNIRQGRIHKPKTNTFSRFIHGEVDVPARWPPGTNEGLHAVDRGRYLSKIQVFDEYFDDSQMLFIRTENLQKRRLSTLARVYRFIGVDATFTPEDPASKNEGSYLHNRRAYHFARKLWLPVKNWLPGAIVQVSQSLRTAMISRAFFTDRRPQMSTEDRVYLRRLYADSIEGLEQRIEHDLSHWT